MLLMPNRRKMITLIVDGLGGMRGPRVPYVQKMGEESNTGEFELPGSDYALEHCMKRFWECADRKDYKGMVEGLKEFLEICNSDHDEGM